MSVLLEAVAERLDLGRVLPGAEVLHGGVNVVHRVRTTTGTYAVHELLGQPALAAVERILGLERLAFAGGVPLAEPVGCCTVDGAGGPVMVHRWVDGEPVDVEALPGPYPASLGRALGRLHAVAPPVEAVDDLWWRDEQPAFDLLEAWEAAAEPTLLFSHRDLTSANVLAVDGLAVLIDWESAGPIGRGAEIGRTALDHGLAGGALVGFLRAYAAELPLPEVGHDWISLWIRGLLLFEHTCRVAVAAGTGPPSLRAFQQDVVDRTGPELARRLRLADDLVTGFRHAVASL